MEEEEENVTINPEDKKQQHQQQTNYLSSAQAKLQFALYTSKLFNMKLLKDTVVTYLNWKVFPDFGFEKFGQLQVMDPMALRQEGKNLFKVNICHAYTFGYF